MQKWFYPISVLPAHSQVCLIFKISDTSRGDLLLDENERKTSVEFKWAGKSKQVAERKGNTAGVTALLQQPVRSSVSLMNTHITGTLPTFLLLGLHFFCSP